MEVENSAKPREHLNMIGDEITTQGEERGWELKVGSDVADVEQVVTNFTDHMNEQQRQAFRDKLQRYVRKPDRAIILAVSGQQILGYILVIERLDFPSDLPGEIAARLRDYGTGTQLMVHPDYRKQGIGSSLFRKNEEWHKERGNAGFWLITHKKDYWYRRDFGYEEIARIHMKGVEKIVMAKKFVC